MADVDNQITGDFNLRSYSYTPLCGHTLIPTSEVILLYPPVWSYSYTYQSRLTRTKHTYLVSSLTVRESAFHQLWLLVESSNCSLL